MKKILILALCITLLPLAAEARRNNQRNDVSTDIFKTQEQQQERIDNAVRSGQLGDFDARRLQKQQDKIDEMIDKAEEDGRVSRMERQRIATEQARASRDIARRMRR